MKRKSNFQKLYEYAKTIFNTADSFDDPVKDSISIMKFIDITISKLNEVVESRLN